MEECLVRIDFSLRWMFRYAQHDRKGAQRDRMARTQILRYAGSLAGARDDVEVVILRPYCHPEALLSSQASYCHPERSEGSSEANIRVWVWFPCFRRRYQPSRVGSAAPAQQEPLTSRPLPRALLPRPPQSQPRSAKPALRQQPSPR